MTSRRVTIGFTFIIDLNNIGNSSNLLDGTHNFFTNGSKNIIMVNMVVKAALEMKFFGAEFLSKKDRVISL